VKWRLLNDQAVVGGITTLLIERLSDQAEKIRRTLFDHPSAGFRPMSQLKRSLEFLTDRDGITEDADVSEMMEVAAST